ncbi:hypothetical protein [Alteromonas sp. 14N.309.X.WAT.G.H12]|uniref:hypothetical protein n=1 Tax=Alteromonas sp. 14N.309.X.WAT.G.H12 TaxID=3120824 RepID=UPI002FD4AA9A
MKQLNTKEIQEVNRGIFKFMGGYVAGKALDAGISWVSSSYENYVGAGNTIEHSMVW